MFNNVIPKVAILNSELTVLTYDIYIFKSSMSLTYFHDETQRGLSGSTFKECGVVDPAFLSYLNVITKANSLLEIPRR